MIRWKIILFFRKSRNIRRICIHVNYDKWVESDDGPLQLTTKEYSQSDTNLKSLQ